MMCSRAGDGISLDYEERPSYGSAHILKKKLLTYRQGKVNFEQ